MTATAAQAWAILKRHARDDVQALRLQDLCKDNDRVSSLVAVHNSEKGGGMLLVDLSRQRMTLETLNHLLRLSVTRRLRKYITRLAWGQNNPDSPLQMTRPVKHHSKRDPRYQHYETAKTTQFEGEIQTESRKDAAGTADESSSDFPAVMPSMHLALRAPKGEGMHMLTLDGVNALTAIHRDWDRLERLSDSIRRGTWRGVTGAMIRDVIVVGRGVSIQALKFVYQALSHDEVAIMSRKFGLDDSNTASRLIRRGLGGASTGSSFCPRKMHFLTSVDPLAAASLVSEMDAGSTMIISLALQGNEETGLTTKAMKSWLLQQLSGGTSSQSTSRKADHILSKHMLLVTGNDQIVQSINKPESVFVIPEHSRCEPFICFTSAMLLPLSIVFGWTICEQFLAGAHDLDCHFVETNPRHNLPVLLALTDIWNDIFLGASSSGRIVTPFTQAMNSFPAFVAALEAQTCSGRPRSDNHNPKHISCSSTVLDGGVDSSYDRSLYQSTKIHNCEVVMVMNSQLKANTFRNLGAQGLEDVFQHADTLMCSLFGHIDELAFGTESQSNSNHVSQDRRLHQEPYLASGAAIAHSSSGNRPSTLLMVSKLDAFACGQLVALSEHRAVVKARIWDIDPFAQQGGCSIKTSRTDQLQHDLQRIYESTGDGDSEEENNTTSSLNLSTKTILGHYANLSKQERIHAK